MVIAIIIMCICFIAVIVMIPILVKQTKKAVEDKKKMETAGPVISRMSRIAKRKLKENGFSASAKDYSTAGYEYFQYKTKYNYEDNLHLVIDHESKQIASFQYVPFHFDLNKTYNDLQFFELYKFSDLTKTDITTNLGVVSSTSIGGGVGTGIGSLGVGVGISDTTSSQMVNSILVTLYFKNGETASANFLDNRSVVMGGDSYNGALMLAKRLLAICEQIIKENEAPAASTGQSSDLEKLEKLKDLMDKGVISVEEFEAQKKEILKL